MLLEKNQARTERVIIRGIATLAENIRGIDVLRERAFLVTDRPKRTDKDVRDEIERLKNVEKRRLENIERRERRKRAARGEQE